MPTTSSRKTSKTGAKRSPSAQPLGPAALPGGFLEFFEPLEKNFEPLRRTILAERARVLTDAHAGKMPGYRAESDAQSGSWKIEPPDWALDQRNQITGPADNAKMLIGMCNSGAPGCMPDGEDSITTDWENLRAAQKNTVAAIRGELRYKDPETGKDYSIRPSKQVVFYRPRGLRLGESRVIEGNRASGSIFDVAMMFHSTLEERRSAVNDAALQPKLCFYIPKVESAKEAGWWSDLIAAMEKSAAIPVGSTKIMFLIESLPAAFQVEEILHAARRHVIGLNLGRWDYMASLIHFKLADPGWILPDRNTIPHDIPFFQNIRYRIVDLCHKRGALAIGGMTALFPNRKDEALNRRALERLAADKKNEAAIGFDGAWTGHPDQQETAVRQFPAPNQLKVRHSDKPEHPDLTPSPAGVGRVTVSGTKDAVRTVIEYRFGVLNGLGARLIPGYDPEGRLIGGFMEDLATDRIYRLMLAQRIRHRVRTEDGIEISSDSLSRWFDEELKKLLDQYPDAETQTKYRRARQWSESMILKGEFDPT